MLFTTNYGKYLKRWEYQTTLPASWETCMQVKKQQLEPDMEEQTGSKLGKEYVKTVYHDPAYLTHMPSTSCEMPGWMKHKLELRLPGEISWLFLKIDRNPKNFLETRKGRVVSHLTSRSVCIILSSLV